MRTTLTLDPDVAARLQAIARERGVSFKEVVNSLLRAAMNAGATSPRRYKVPARRLGLRPGVDLDKAHRLASEMEDDEIARKLELRK
jgi:hypothetical protein